MCSVWKVAIIGFILCSLGNLIFSVRSGMVLGGKSPSQTKLTGTSFLLLSLSPDWSKTVLAAQGLNVFFHQFLVFF